ncbi:MAG: FAD-dependent oxidoreductase [Clostridiales bacterium]|jgi:glycine/D-amino acid oxidase-like deaminating enzyme|nr:FAD-dependent oxidoreductase [Clostridiales bacterium]
MNESIWYDTEIEKRPQAQGKLKTQVIIVGGGIAGITAAYKLSQNNIDVILLEARRIVHGVTGNTTGKITAQHDLIYGKLSRKSSETAKLYAESNQTAIEEYAKIIKEENIDCDFVREHANIYTTDPNSVQTLEKEFAKALESGLDALITLENSLPFKTCACYRINNQARFHPLKYLRRLAELSEKNGVKIYENSRVLEISNHEVYTKEAIIKGEHIIVATHYPIINTPGYYFTRMYQHRSCAIALKGVPPIDGMYLSYEQDGKSFRMQKDLLILGGADYKTGTEGKKNHYEMLEHFASEHYTNYTIESAWSAQDCITLDGLPYIGHYSGKLPDIYVLTGFAKWGMTLSMVGSMLITDLILGKNNPWEELYSPKRAIGGKAILKGSGMGLSSAGHLTAGLFSHHKCPHMGCKLTYNAEEFTWDCPCHGSRMTRKGEIIDAPAIL